MNTVSSMKTVRILLVITAALVLVGCSYKGPKTDSSAGTTLVNTYWKLVATDGTEIKTPADSRETHLILRPDFRITGFGSCNDFSGSWEMDEGELIIGPLAATKMSCPRMDTEYLMMSALNGEVITEITDDRLTIFGNDGTELHFQAMYFDQ